MGFTKIFLKAKHWQLFLLIFGIPMFFQFTTMGVMISNIANSATPDPTFMFNYMKFFPILMIVFAGLFFGWFWSIATGLQDKVPANVKMKVKKFKILFFIPITYMIIISILIGSVMAGFQDAIDTGSQPDVGLIGSFAAIIIPLHLFSMFCIFYSLYFVAKTIKTIELQRETSFSDFAGEFFLIWFYPIGIWIIQPRINKMIENEKPNWGQTDTIIIDN